MAETEESPSVVELVAKTSSTGSYDDCWEPPPPPQIKKTSYPLIRVIQTNSTQTLPHFMPSQRF